MRLTSASHVCVSLQVDEPAVWSELGHAQLDHGLVGEAIASYLRSNDTSRSSDVIERSKEVTLLLWYPVCGYACVSLITDISLYCQTGYMLHRHFFVTCITRICYRHSWYLVMYVRQPVCRPGVTRTW